MNAVGVTIGNGQVTMFVLVAALFSIALLHSKNLSIHKQFLVAILIVISLIKPSVTFPFLWIILFIVPMPRVILTTVVIYIILTFLAFYFQESHQTIKIDTITTIAKSTYKNVGKAISTGSQGGGYANIHSLLEYFELGQWNIISSIILCIMFGFWIFKNKQSDLWILLAITAIFSRFWMYHRVYDNILIFIPMLTLFRLTKS